jgi:hypothetical protein
MLVEDLRAVMRIILKPDLLARELYDRAAAIVRVYPKDVVFGSGEHDGFQDAWFHLGYGNLNSHTFSVTPLKLLNAVVVDGVQLARLKLPEP